MSDSRWASSLHVHEWMAVVLLIVSVLIICFVTHFNIDAIKYSSNQPSDTHDVIVKGAVDREGIYRIGLKMTLGELLTICEVCPNADLRRYKLDNPLKKGRVLNIRPRKVIRVHVSGAVITPGTIEMFPGQRYADLRKKIELLSDADDSILKKKGVLKDNQKIDVPFRKSYQK